MKRLLAYLVIILCLGLVANVKADDIRDFQIEGMSIGDSLLNYYNENEINNNYSKSRILKGTNYSRSCFIKSNSIYEKLCIDFKNDTNKIIHGVQGVIRYKKINNPACLNKLREIDKEFSNIFKNLDRKDWGLLKLPPRPDEDSYYPIIYKFAVGSKAQIGCYFYKKYDSSHLRVVLYTKEMSKIIKTKAAKK